MDEATKRLLEQNDGLYAAIQLGGNLQKQLAEGIRSLLTQIGLVRYDPEIVEKARRLLEEYDNGGFDG